MSKTVFVWAVQGYYVDAYGWETLCSEDTREEARDRLAEYDANEPGVRHRIRRVIDEPGEA